MKRLALFGSLFVLVVGGAVVAGGIWLFERPPAGGTVELSVASGESFSEIAEKMEQEGLVVSAFRARVLARLLDRDRDVQAGIYRLTRGLSPERVLDDLVSGRVLLHRVKVIEGARLAQIAAAVQDSLGIRAEDFLRAASDPARRARVRTPAANVEGYLFPDTDLFPDGVAAGEVLDKMIARFEEVWAGFLIPPPPSLDRHGVVTLASIVEAETPLAREKPRVAAVYLNRIQQGWRLQADPTVRYGLNYWEARLYYKQLEIDTPYNTYRRDGLPPGPIGSPGREALAGVLSPLRPCDDLFFVASGGGGHVFSRTKREHDRAVRALRAASAG